MEIFAMPNIIIEIHAPELTDALNNLARAQMATAEAFNRLMGSSNYSVNPNPLYPPDPTLTAHTTANMNSTYGAPSVYPVDQNMKAANLSYPYPISLREPNVSADTVQQNLPSQNLQKSPDSNMTFDDLARGASTLMKSGQYMQLVELLGKFGVQTLSQLPKEHFGAFAVALRKLGAFI